MPNAHLSIVGAGPGDPELISLKAVRLLQQAEVVLYDALVHPDVLLHCPQAVLVPVGKRAGVAESTAQETIHELIYHYARTHTRLLRLKGGDPFIFGRGQEEARFAQSIGLSVEVVPGLSSVNGAPAVAGIPLTLRGVADGYTVITATAAGGGLCEDLARAFATRGTVVILMGMQRLGAIAACCLAQGLGQVSAAIIQAAGFEHQRVAIGTAAQLETLARTHGLGTPGIVVIGEVVAHRLQLPTAPAAVSAVALHATLSVS
jgi:uroporphyrin-III C-methyltransferase